MWYSKSARDVPWEEDDLPEAGDLALTEWFQLEVSGIETQRKLKKNSEEFQPVVPENFLSNPCLETLCLSEEKKVNLYFDAL